MTSQINRASKNLTSCFRATSMLSCALAIALPALPINLGARASARDPEAYEDNSRERAANKFRGLTTLGDAHSVFQYTLHEDRVDILNLDGTTAAATKLQICQLVSAQPVKSLYGTRNIECHGLLVVCLHEVALIYGTAMDLRIARAPRRLHAEARVVPIELADRPDTI
ncbi:MAG: hypothetical protein AAFY15_10790, partial [Cyanobacteria bacterium J06648_11]